MSNKKLSKNKKYIEVKNYEEDYNDVEQNSEWKKIKVTLCAMAVASIVALIGTSQKQINDNITKIFDNSDDVSEEEIQITLSEATDEQIEEAKEKIEQIIEDSEYEFESLSEDELLDAYFRISYQLKDISEAEYKIAFFSGKDQDKLDDIAKSSYDEETYINFTEEQIYDLRKLTYELTSDSIKTNYLRDPENIPKTNLEKEAEENLEL